VLDDDRVSGRWGDHDFRMTDSDDDEDAIPPARGPCRYPAAEEAEAMVFLLYFTWLLHIAVDVGLVGRVVSV
jgi:hypothetical protein